MRDAMNRSIPPRGGSGTLEPRGCAARRRRAPAGVALVLAALLGAAACSDDAPSRPVATGTPTTPGVPAPADPHAAADNPLATDAQRELLAAAGEILARPEVRQATEDATAKPAAGYLDPQDRADVQAWVPELARSMAISTANLDPARPRLEWNNFAGARWGVDNPDTIYRFAPVSADSTYTITGRRNTAADVSIQVVEGIGDGRETRTLATFPSPGTGLTTAPDGTFTLTLDATPANGRPNHIQLPPGAQRLVIRDTLADWTQIPMDLEIARTAGPPPAPPADNAALARTTAERIRAQAPFWPTLTAKYFGGPANTLSAPRGTGGSGLPTQVSSSANFRLPDGQALVITVGRGPAAYLGLQIASSAAFASFDHDDRTNSLTAAQARPDADGRYTFVISRTDPGTPNWLDPVGHDHGLLFIRWQGLTGALDPADAPRMTLVPTAELTKNLPPLAAPATPTDRQAQTTQRNAEFRARFNGLPAPS
ncbi:hypothetical protein [Streptodolium elevatio]